jgi:hypothetical protein
MTNPRVTAKELTVRTRAAAVVDQGGDVTGDAAAGEGGQLTLASPWPRVSMTVAR